MGMKSLLEDFFSESVFFTQIFTGNRYQLQPSHIRIQDGDHFDPYPDNLYGSADAMGSRRTKMQSNRLGIHSRFLWERKRRFPQGENISQKDSRKIQYR